MMNPVPSWLKHSSFCFCWCRLQIECFYNSCWNCLILSPKLHTAKWQPTILQWCSHQTLWTLERYQVTFSKELLIYNREEDTGGTLYRKKNWEILKYCVENRWNSETAFRSLHNRSYLLNQHDTKIILARMHELYILQTRSQISEYGQSALRR